MKYILPERKPFENDKSLKAAAAAGDDDDNDDDGKVGGLARVKGKAAYAGESIDSIDIFDYIIGPHYILTKYTHYDKM